ncbi:MAG: Crp/Fnr family transcriptional regulator [Archangium sp.]|nr:Crp/Fnr family transcriptional regulator [Archangium sp.]MDP3156678.1 Crp/Fnr family transcriptional regulator [Archangium sp.]MDP3570619.1 Crp/Fnr family transcriptional regulator [Archangium sp.]
MSAPRARIADPEVLAHFEAAPLFRTLTPAERAALARHTRVVSLRAHGVLWREGDEATQLGLVLHGRVAIERASLRRLMVDVAGEGQLVGEVALSLGAAYQFDVRCLRKARVALVPAPALHDLMGRQPGLGLALAATLGHEVLRLTRRLEALSAGNVSQRLARVLLGLTERFGTPFPGGTLMPVRLRREDLAALAATTVESASRQISAWKRQGVLVPQPAGFLVKDFRALRLLGDLVEP